MIDFIYSMHPYWLRASINTVILIILFSGIIWVRRRIIRDNEDHDAVNGASAVVAMMYAIFLGFVIFSSVNNLGVAADSATTEAHLVSTINYEASFLSKPLELKTREILKQYLTDVINKEWPAMKVGETNVSGLSSLKKLKALLLNNKPTDAESVDINLWTDLVQRTNDLYQEHANRTAFAQDLSLSKGVWYCLVAATVIMLISNMFFYFSKRKAHIILLSCVGVITGLLLFLEVSINFPYRGYYGVTPDGFVAVLQQLNLW